MPKKITPSGQKNQGAKGSNVRDPQARRQCSSEEVASRPAGPSRAVRVVLVREAPVLALLAKR